MTAPETARFLDRLLEEEERGTAVERFAQAHAGCERPLHEGFYRDLIPLARPGEGEQYAFEVDLDRCSGCKACVAACHELNGLEEGETWRSVGLLGAEADSGLTQHVTTACHHCADPGCLKGCPVMAYEKDAETGIVHHLDDQCIGCKYCTLTCPYEVPTYLPSKGIVRKCDLCRQRLAADEAPACVQSCPSRAIRVSVVPRAGAAAEDFPPGAPDPRLTSPTTRYRSARAWPADARAVDAALPRPADAHDPLAVMLVATQASVGGLLVSLLGGMAGAPLAWRVRLAIAAMALGLIGLGASTAHLGRPHLAFRAFLGLRTSWLSREIVVFGAFAGAGLAHVAALVAQARDLPVPAPLIASTGIAALLAGVAGIVCSLMIYAVTGRPLWSARRASPRFASTTALGGLALAAAAGERGAAVVGLVVALGAMMLVAERGASRDGALATTRALLAGPLRARLRARRALLALGISGLVVAGLATEASAAPLVAVAAALALLVSEGIERHLFFVSSSAPRMPGLPVAAPEGRR